MSRKRKRPKVVDLEARVELVRRLIGRCHTKSMIKREVRKKYGNLSARTIENYIARARARAAEDAGRGRQRLRIQQGEFYIAMMAEGDCDTVKVRAAERFDKLNGLERPAASTVNVTGTGEGGAVKVESKSKVTHDGGIAITPAALAAFLADVAASGNRNVSSDSNAKSVDTKAPAVQRPVC